MFHETNQRVKQRLGVSTQLGTGFIGGVIGGLLGGGSGVFYVPALERMTSFSRATLHGTAGAANIAVTGVGAATFALAIAARELYRMAREKRRISSAAR